MAFDRSIIDEYERGGEVLRAAIAGLTPEQLTARPIAGTWSIHEIVVHLMDSDSIGVDRMKRIIAEELPLLIGYNETRYIERLFPHAQPSGQTVAQFDRTRRMFAIILRKLPDDAFERAGIHNEVGKLALGEMLKKYDEHLKHHLSFIAKKRAMVSVPAKQAAPASENDAKLIAEYEQGPARVRAAISGLSPQDMLARPVEGMWSTHEVLIHLADADVVFAHRLKRIIAENRPRYDGWSENDFVANLVYDQQSAEDAVATIELTHRQLLKVLRTLPVLFLDRVGVHSDRGEQTARQVLEYATWHINHHLKFVKDKRERLGKAQA